MIRALLIDLDGLIRIWDGSDAKAVEERFDLPVGTIPRTAFAPALLIQAVAGESTNEAWRQEVAVRLRGQLNEADADEAVGIWSTSSGRVNWDVLDLVRTCRRRSRVILVTNATSRLSADLTRLDISDEFDAIINSSEIGYAKPDTHIYEAALQASSVSAREALFVDDSSAHVEAAMTLGMAGHVYAGAPAFRVELQRYKLL